MGDLFCPQCWHARERKQPNFDITNGVISLGRRRILSPQRVVEFGHVLFKRAPNIVPRDYIVSSVFGIIEPNNASNLLSIYATQLRKLIRPLGFDIKASNGRGYVVMLFEPCKTCKDRNKREPHLPRPSLRWTQLQRSSSRLCLS